MISTVNAQIGDRFLDTGLHTTTPDAPELQGYLAQMVDSNLEYVVLETTSHGLAQHRVTGCTHVCIKSHLSLIFLHLLTEKPKVLRLQIILRWPLPSPV